MSHENVTGALDPDLLDEMSTRRGALRAAGSASAKWALASIPLAFAATAKSAFAQGLPQEILDVLNFALTLEYLENEFYLQGLAASGLIPAEDRSIFQTIQAHEQAHVDFLLQALGSAATAKPQFDFTAGGAFDTFENYETFKLLSQAYEDTGVRAYKGQAPNLIGNDTVLTAALEIHAVEARHAARVRRLRGLQGWIPQAQPGAPAPVQPVYAGEDQTMQLTVNVPGASGVGGEAVSEAFDEPLTMQQVLAIAQPFIAG